MPVQYYGINQSNNTFHYRNTTTNTNTEISIPRGDYTPAALASNVAAAVNSVFSSGTQFTCAYDEATRKFTMSIPTGYASGYFTSFFDKGQTHAHSKRINRPIATPTKSLEAIISGMKSGKHV